jgi:hypothetical protein
MPKPLSDDLRCRILAAPHYVFDYKSALGEAG